jgi:hypothetical protein
MSRGERRYFSIVPETDPIAIANEVPKVVHEEIDWTLPINDRRAVERDGPSAHGNVSFMLGSQVGRFRRFLRGHVFSSQFRGRR